MEPTLARRMWYVLEPYHAVVYFAPERAEHYGGAGLKGGWMGYFASRAAAMGPVSAEVVIATFYNFHPDMVRRAIPDAWRFSSPERVLEARYAVADAALRRCLGASVDSEGVRSAAELARHAAEACSLEGRPLFAAHAGLPWPEESHLELWHAATLLREHRGDGHVIALVDHQIHGLEAHVLVAAAGVTPAAMLREFRRWSEEEWAAAARRLRERGYLEPDGRLSRAGRELRAHIEADTDRLALAPYAALGEEDRAALEAHMKLLVDRIEEASGIAYPNPIGLAAPS